jgi:flagellar biosynthesis protein FlhB
MLPFAFAAAVCFERRYKSAPAKTANGTNALAIAIPTIAPVDMAVFFVDGEGGIKGLVML